MSIKKYIVKAERFSYDYKIPPFIEELGTFNSFDDAEEYASKYCEEEADYYNQETDTDLFFDNSVESEKYDCQTVAWDGDDYRIVTGYFIEESEVDEQ